MDFSLIDIFLHLDRYIEPLIAHYGAWIYAMLFLVVFCETGLVVTPLLPGDALLFITGAMAALGHINFAAVCLCLFAAAALGDNTNYCIGRTLGKVLFRNPDSKIFRQDYLLRTEDFYRRHGGKAVSLARFFPIVRTFTPFVAGLGHMSYPRFLAFSLIGSAAWVTIMCALGYFFGNIPFIRQHLTLLVLLVVAASLAPLALAALRGRKAA